MARFLEKLQYIDRRYLYLVLAVVVALPVFVSLPLPIEPSQETLGAYRAVESVPPGKIVLIQSDWDAGSKGENQGQAEAIIDHLMRRNIKFAVISANPYGPPFAEMVDEVTARRYGKRYGVDWVNFGYKIFPGTEAYVLPSLARDIPGTVKTDYRGTPLSKIPMMAGVKDIHDVAVVFNIGYGQQLLWIPFVQSVYGTKMVFAIAAINSTTMYSYITAGQLAGMLVGAQGGAEYEALIGYEKRTGRVGWGNRVIQSQSWAHGLIILLIIIGNVGYAFARPETKRARLGMEDGE
jgi:hypothetical protein